MEFASGTGQWWAELSIRVKADVRGGSSDHAKDFLHFVLCTLAKDKSPPHAAHSNNGIKRTSIPGPIRREVRSHHESLRACMHEAGKFALRHIAGKRHRLCRLIDGQDRPHDALFSGTLGIDFQREQKRRRGQLPGTFPKVALIDRQSRLAIQFVEDILLGLCDAAKGPKRLPAAGGTATHLEFLAMKTDGDNLPGACLGPEPDQRLPETISVAGQPPEQRDSPGKGRHESGDEFRPVHARSVRKNQNAPQFLFGDLGGKLLPRRSAFPVLQNGRRGKCQPTALETQSHRPEAARSDVSLENFARRTAQDEARSGIEGLKLFDCATCRQNLLPISEAENDLRRNTLPCRMSLSGPAFRLRPGVKCGFHAECDNRLGPCGLKNESLQAFRVASGRLSALVGCMRRLRARLVLPIGAPPLPGGVVTIEGSRILSVGPHEGLPCEDLGDVVLMPGLVNAHCHLDYTGLRGAILPSSSFATWIRRINELKRTLSDAEYLSHIESGFLELARHGTTTVCNIESFPELMVRMRPPLIRTWWFYEMLDIRSRIHTEDVVAGALSFFEGRPEWPGGFGLSPHAPYTTSLDLYRLARHCCAKYFMPFTTHVAETEEEFDMFANASGALHRLLGGLGRDMSDTGGSTALGRLMEGGALPSDALLAHMNILTESDWSRLRGTQFSIVHCPGCHLYFERPPFAAERFVAEGFNLCLGTDSLASNKRLDMFREMQLFQRAHPSVGASAILRMATVNGARALGQTGKLGTLAPGAWADMIAVPVSGVDAGDVDEAVVWHTGPVVFSWVNGRELSFPNQCLPANADEPPANRTIPPFEESPH